MGNSFLDTIKDRNRRLLDKRCSIRLHFKENTTDNNVDIYENICKTQLKATNQEILNIINETPKNASVKQTKHRRTKH